MNEIEVLAANHPTGSLAKLLAKWQREAAAAAAAIPRQEGRIDRAKRCIRALELIGKCVQTGHFEAAISLAFSVPEAAYPIPFDGDLMRIHVVSSKEAEVLNSPYIKSGDIHKDDLSALLPPEGRTDRARRKTGKNRAIAKHGDLSEEAPEWQAEMDKICKRRGMSRSQAWFEAEAKTGRKRETMEKYGVFCPIAAKRGPPPKKLPPRT